MYGSKNAIHFLKERKKNASGSLDVKLGQITG